MPKPAADSLEKKFVCQYCNESVRIRQGLSGHIQFKHSDKHTVKEIDFHFIISKMPELVVWRTSPGVPQLIQDAAGNLIGGWLHIRSFCRTYDIELTKQDFKNYILTGLAQAFGRAQLG